MASILESEVRQLHRIGDDGSVGEWLGHGYANQSVMLEEERFHSIDTPLLAMFSYPSAPNPGQTSDPAKLAAYRAAETSRKEAQIAIFREQPHAKVIVIPNSTHFISARQRTPRSWIQQICTQKLIPTRTDAWKWAMATTCIGSAAELPVASQQYETELTRCQ